MAPARTKLVNIGSAQWIQQERDHAADFVAQEVEEFGFSVRNEMEWLNEHMAEIFTKSQMNFADVFKTPGKLRGKTPRTARQRDDTLQRQPLGDIFAPNPQSTSAATPRNPFYEKVAQFVVAQDSENRLPEPRPESRIESSLRIGKVYVDSGYHGSTEDELEENARTLADTQENTQETGPHQIPSEGRENITRQSAVRGKLEDVAVSDESFVSAKEQKSDAMINGDEELAGDAQFGSAADPVPRQKTEDQAISVEVAPLAREDLAQDITKDVGMESEMDTPKSETSSPEKPLQRKSSFTFSSLPAREPLASKRSLGTRLSQPPAQQENERTDTVSDSKSSTQLLHERITMLGKTRESRTSKSIPQSAFVTQQQPLYPQLPDVTQSVPDQDPPDSVPDLVAKQDNDSHDEDWIAPTRPQLLTTATSASEVRPKTALPSPANKKINQKASIAAKLSPSRSEMQLNTLHQKASTLSQTSLVSAAQNSWTPVGSPAAKKQYEGPLSASKNRLWSALKSAKNIFASSASTSAAAKLEAHNSSPVPRKPASIEASDNMASEIPNIPGAVYSNNSPSQSPVRSKALISESPTRKTRSSTESNRKREREIKAQQKISDELEIAREKERLKAAKQKEDRQKTLQEEQDRKHAAAPADDVRPASADSDERQANDMPPPTISKSTLGKLRAPGRVMKPSKENLQSKPAPVSIRVASQAQRFGHGFSASTLSRSQHENSSSASLARDSTRTPSAQGNRPNTTAPSNARLKALEAAARKKEADDKATQKKLEQKRELEKKRAAKAEEERRAEDERKLAEQQRIQEAKLATQKKAEKQAADSRRREQESQKREQERLQQQRLEQEQRENELREQEIRECEAENRRQQEEARRAKEAHELAEAIKRERAQHASTHLRADVPGTLRQLTKASVVIQPNPAKPAKRHLLDDAESQQSQRPGIQRGPPSYQQTESKRRRTNEEHEKSSERPSVMAPPKRPSTFRKETLNKFSHGYAPAPPPGSHYKSIVNGQHQHYPSSAKVPPSQMVQISNARIPFAETTGGPSSFHAPHQSSQQLSQQQHLYPGHESSHQQSVHHVTNNKFKTPARPAMQAPKSAKSTPSYPNGDQIELPDIATDSEDEDSEDDGGANGGFRAPSWVASPALRDLLTQQQLVDPETVFGPIGELKMEEVFKNGKNQERLKRFRDRGSSARWVETGDAVTSAEKRRDMELRERVAREGGWRYEPSH